MSPIPENTLSAAPVPATASPPTPTPTPTMEAAVETPRARFAPAALLKTLRPHQWVKNLFVAAPLVFAQRLFEAHTLRVAWGSVGRVVAAAGAFCLLSGAVYVVNDIVDIEKDRAHPTKRLRPIPSGQLPIPVALAWAGCLFVAALAASLLLGPWVLLAAAAYAVLNLFYSLRLKHVAFLDVLSIAAGFLLRVLAGSYAIAVEPSGWLLACTALLACFLGFGKRAHELASAGAGATAQRAVLSRYRLDQLRWALRGLALATVVVYVLYTRAGRTVAFFHSARLVWTAPFCVLGIARFLVLVGRSPTAESPTDAMLRDWPFLLNLGLWAAAVTAIIYVRP